MLRILWVSLICFWGNYCFGQQLPQLSTHPNFYGYYNPASPESMYLLKRKGNVRYLSLFYKDQWLGSKISESPYSMGADFHFPIDRKWATGLGMLADKAGAIGSWQAYGRGSRNLSSGNGNSDLFIGGGLLAGGTNIDLDKIEESDRSDPILNNDINKPFFIRASIGIFGRKDYGPRFDLFGGISMLQFHVFNENRTLGNAHHFYGKLGFLYKTVADSEKDQQYLEASIHTTYIPATPADWEVVLNYYFDFIESDNTLSVGLGFNNRKVFYLKSLFLISNVRLGLGFNAGLLTLKSSPIKDFSNENALEIRIVFLLNK